MHDPNGFDPEERIKRLMIIGFTIFTFVYVGIYTAILIIEKLWS
jgi:hypothetical protein